MSTAICDVMGTSQQIANMFIHCSWCNEHFSVKVLQHIRVGIIRAHIHEELTHTHWGKKEIAPVSSYKVSTLISIHFLKE